MAIISVGANLRAPLTSVGPLVGNIRASLGISSFAAGFLTTLPLLAFAAVSPFAPKLSRRFGMQTVLFGASVLITAGVFLRMVSHVGPLFAGTLLIGLGIAFGNVLIPGLIKSSFPHHIGLMTGIYAVSMNVCAAIASGLSVPVAGRLGWNGSLGYWGFISLVAILVLLPQVKLRRSVSAGRAAVQKGANMWKSKLAWCITVFMGLQSLIFYTTVAWLPEIMTERGITVSAAGWMLSIMQFALIPFTFIIPIIAGKMKSQIPLVILTGALFIGGTLGILFGSTSLMVVWAILIGIGGGTAFSLAMMFFSLRTRSSQEASELSGMAQSFGYLLAAAGPALFGVLHDATNSWTLPLLLLLGVSVAILLAGLVSGRNVQIR
ncbi:CP family cyanate transporter-like MFS transporter [Bhargavaea ullalensis]|uniref:CP family cyanate transporter-like MFS transporter n=1 Tax=Bhargavaea ullalensis TaxID=1265685 RepID=A0ABV2GCZ9_9BACL